MGSFFEQGLTMDTMGVMPEPAAMKQCFLFIVIGVKDKIARVPPLLQGRRLSSCYE